jgi:uncharacterized protein (DUF433 family)
MRGDPAWHPGLGFHVRCGSNRCCRILGHGASTKEELMTLNQIVHSDPEILGGTPVFVGTRVPVRILLDYLEGGEPLEEFLDNYPGVSREQAVAFIEEAGRVALAQIA